MVNLRSIPEFVESLLSHRGDPLDPNAIPFPSHKLPSQIGDRSAYFKHLDDYYAYQIRLLRTENPNCKEIEAEGSRFLVYMHGIDGKDERSKTSPIHGEYLDSNELSINVINYFRAALLIIKHIPLSETQKQRRFNQLMAMYAAITKRLQKIATTVGLSESDKFDLKCNEVNEFEKSICQSLDIQSDALVVAREWVLLKKSEYNVVTLESNMDPDEIKYEKFKFNLTAPIKLKEKDIKQYFEPQGVTPQSSILAQWRVEGIQEYGEWFRILTQDQEEIAQVASVGASVSPSGRMFPWLANAKKVRQCDLLRNIVEGREMEPVRLISSSMRVQAGIIIPFKIKHRQARIQYGLNNLEALIRDSLIEQMEEHYNKFHILYPSSSTIPFSVRYQSFLSPQALEIFFSKIHRNNNNALFVRDKNEIIKKIRAKINANPNAYFKELLGRQYTKNGIKIKVEPEHPIYYKIKIVNPTNHPVNKLNNLFLNPLSIKNGDNIDQANRIIRSVGDELKALYHYLLETEKANLKEKLEALKNNELALCQLENIKDNPQKIEDLKEVIDFDADQFRKNLTKYNYIYDFARHLQRSADYNGNLWGLNIAPDKLSEKTKFQVQELYECLANPDARLNFLSRAAKTELAEKIKAAIELRAANQEFELSRHFRRLVKAVDQLPLWQQILPRIILLPFQIAAKAVMFVPNVFQYLWNRAWNYNAPLKQAVDESICQGSSALGLESCKSSRERANLKAATEISTRELYRSSPDIFKTSSSISWWSELQPKMANAYRHAYHSMARYGHVIKLGLVGRIYEKFLGERFRNSIEKIRLFMKPIKRNFMSTFFAGSYLGAHRNPTNVIQPPVLVRRIDMGSTTDIARRGIVPSLKVSAQAPVQTSRNTREILDNEQVQPACNPSMLTPRTRSR